jgi:hypothetical protein
MPGRRMNMKPIIKNDNRTTSGYQTALNLKKGDLVKVRPRSEIEETLDKSERFQGCGFMESMWQYCGGTYKVLKRVELVLDPWESRLRRCRDTVALEGLYCHGDPKISIECDRTCIFYWKEVWLEKVSIDT